MVICHFGPKKDEICFFSKHDCMEIKKKKLHKELLACSFLQTNVGGSRISLEYSLSYCSESI